MIPKDLHAFLSGSDRRIVMTAGEIREAVFFAADKLRLKTFDVDSGELFSRGLLEENPDETREYQGYDLIESCNDYDAEGILIWFPGWKEYGSWDLDHHRIITYPNVAWKKIAKQPTWYINGQWYPDKIPHREINPWGGEL